MATDSGNTPVLMVLGDFQFSLNTLVFQEWQRKTGWKWPGQERFGQLDALQFTGLGEDTLQLPGVLYPNWRGDIANIDDLRAMGDEGQPFMLVDSMGNVLGRWVIESFEEKQSLHDATGKPRKVDFVLSLKKYDDGETADDGASILDQVSSAATAVASGTDAAAVSSFSSMASSIQSTAANALGNLKSAVSSVTATVAPVLSEAASAVGALNRSIDVVNDLRSTAADVAAQVKSIGNTAAAIGGAKTLLGKISALGMGAASATRVVENVALIGGTSNLSVSSVMASAHAATTSVSSLLASASSASSKLISSLTS